MIKVSNTELILSKDVIEKAKHLGQMMMEAEEVKVYLQAEEKIKSHERVQSLIAEVKKKQKEIVAFEQLKYEPMIGKVQAELDELNGELDSIPVVQTFQQAQMDVNYMLQLVIGIIADTVSEKINIETGGEVAGGCGTSGGT
jgi:cell fate (sporulation/competence/biofilm development) regulator YmcA (YheA/YmcA/DUF963 family)